MPKYRKKPVVIEAQKWTRHQDKISGVEIGPHEIPDKYLDDPCSKCRNPMREHGSCPTLEGKHIVCPGDWIIKGVQGEFYPCKPDIFRETYDKVEG